MNMAPLTFIILVDFIYLFIYLFISSFVAKSLSRQTKADSCSFSSSLSDGPDANNIISILNVASMHWSSLLIDGIPSGIDLELPNLNLIGHAHQRSRSLEHTVDSPWL